MAQHDYHLIAYYKERYLSFRRWVRVLSRNAVGDPFRYDPDVRRHHYEADYCHGKVMSITRAHRAA